MLEIRINMIIARDPQLINSLDRNKKSSFNQKKVSYII